MSVRKSRSDYIKTTDGNKSKANAEKDNTTATPERGSETTLSSLQSSLGTSEAEELKSKDKDSAYREENEGDDEIKADQKPIRWVNIIFLPFESWWQLIILFCVFIKGIFAPFAAIYPQIRCPKDTVDSYTEFLIFFYMNFADPIYIIDTFMYILHRQVTDAAMQREHLPKAAWMIILDICGLLPFYVLFANEYCQNTVQLWPNIVLYSELLVSYRIGHYFSLNVTHSYWDLSVGYLLYFVLMINGLTAFLLVLTKHGLCKKCHKGIYDWRAYNDEKIAASGDVGEYIYAASFITSLITNRMNDETSPTAYLEFILMGAFSLTGFIISTYILVPKLFSENIFHSSRIYHFQTRVNKVINIIKTRKLTDDYIQVETFYSFIWRRQNGVSKVPSVIFQLPKNLQTDLRLDLTWMVFYHSPNLRNTSAVFKRWLCSHIVLSYKLPGERFFHGSQCFSRLYYIKSGIVQIFSSDDSIAAIISVSAGTLIGDINFLLPQAKKKLFARCLTYCEIFSITRGDLLTALIKFPDDKRHVLKLTKDRLKHAQQLHAHKKQNKVEDRNEEEGIAWLKKRWWDVFELIKDWKSTSTKKSCKIPAEIIPYHCPKYIGLLVLCKDITLREASLFLRLEFPYILAANSVFVNIWRKVVTVTVFLVLIWFPPALARLECGRQPVWFHKFSFGVSTIYIFDVIIFMLTAKHGEEIMYDSTFGSVFNRCKDVRFFMDVLSTPIIDIFFILESTQKYQNLARFNRLIKTHILFYSTYKRDWFYNHQYFSYLKMALFCFIMLYIPPFAIAVVSLSTSYLTINHFFFDSDRTECAEYVSNLDCARHIFDNHGICMMFYFWVGTLILYCHGIVYHIKGTLYDVVTSTLVMSTYIISSIFLNIRNISILFLKNRPIEDFQYLVSKIKHFYLHWKTHPHLMKRLNSYFYVHWKYQRGINFLYSNLLKDEPFDVYWKVYGQTAEKAIAESQIFKGADPEFIRKLIPKAKFIIIPKNGNLLAFGMLSEHLTFLIRGVVLCEYQDENNVIQRRIVSDSLTMGVTMVFFKQPVMKTYAAVTDTEILCISRNDLLQILHRFPAEKEYFQTCIKELGLLFDKLFRKEVLRKKEYQVRVRRRIFHNEMNDDKSVEFPEKQLKPTEKKKCKNGIKCITSFWGFFKEYRTNPESRFIRIWMVSRAIVATVILLCATLRGTHLATFSWVFTPIEYFCASITTLDIILKLFLPYYDKRGIAITSKRKCAMHYLTRGFCIDVFSWICQWPIIVRAIIGGSIKRKTNLMIIMFGKSCATYLVHGIFDYYADVPSVNNVYIMILKWQVMLLFLFSVASMFLVLECCETVQIGEKQKFRYLNDSCWMPVYFKLDPDGDRYISFYEYQLICAQSWSLTQNAFYNTFNGQNHFNKDRELFTIIFCCLFLFFWYQMCHCQAALILHFRSDHLVRHSINQLKQFLKSERIDESVIKRAMKYCDYWCERTSGFDQQFLAEKISIVFRQDFFYYFYKRTLKGANTIFQTSESSLRQLAGLLAQAYFLPDEDIIREMDLCDTVYIVHRGRAAVQLKGKIFATLTKGCVFGLLNGKTIRPAPVTVHTEDYTDLLCIPAEDFQGIISNDLMKEPVATNQSIWYRRWLLWSWILCPLLTCLLVSFYINTADEHSYIVKIPLFFFDIVYVLFLVTEFYTMKLIVKGGQCEYKRVGFKVLLNFGYIIQWLTVLSPLMRNIIIFHNIWWIHLFRYLRLYSIKFYWKEFYSDYGGKTAPRKLKSVLVFSLLLVLSTGWIALTCRRTVVYRTNFPETNLDYIPSDIKYVDFEHWMIPNLKKEGCARTSRSYAVSWLDRRTKNFYVSRDWYMDYVIAFSYIIVLQTRLNIDTVMPVDLIGIYCKLFASHVLYLARLWVCSYAISSIYGKYREMYHFDYNVYELLKFMRTNGVSYLLTHSVEVYTKMLWKRQKGSQLAEITYQLPLCLQEDVFEALYMYHLQTPVLFQSLPHYFLRQMVVRMKRNFVFPGKYIVLEGDIHSCLYFIHEGDVEKWYTDHNGDNRLASVLTTNGYFGILPGLFPNVPYQFSYYSRTVVDIVSLTHSDWRDLLDGYPDIRNKLYSLASRMKTEKIYADKKV